jgi:hypothetical protein
MGGMKVHWWRGTRFQRFMPASHAKTPTIPFFQSGEAILWRYQVVAAGFQNRGVVRSDLPGSRLNIQHFFYLCLPPTLIQPECCFVARLGRNTKIWR